MSRDTVVIAEIGENHVGDWDRAREMIGAAADAGADVVKFQSYRGDQVAADDPEKEWFTRVQLPDEVHEDLRATAQDHGVEFLSSPFSLERTRFLVEDLGMDAIKVASSEMTNEPMLEYLNDNVETVYLSTGMATLEEVRASVDRLSRVDDLTIMQCTSEYPCPPSDANLSVVETFRREFSAHRIGFSDHTLGTLAPAMAVGLGARVVEKHFTLDKSLEGTDHILSVTPPELREMIGRIERVETLLGTGQKRPTEAESEIVSDVRNRFHESE